MPKDFPSTQGRLHKHRLRGSGGGGKGGGHTPTEDKNTIQTNHVLRLIEVLGEGPISAVQQVYLDETAVTDDDGNATFEGVTIENRMGTPDQSHVEGFTSQQAESIVDARVTEATPVVQTITNPDTDACRVVVKLPALFKYQDDGDMVVTDVSYRIQYMPDDGVEWIDIPGSPIVWDNDKCTAPAYPAHRFNLTGAAPWQVRVVRVTPDSDDDTKLQNDTYFYSIAEIIEQKLSYRNSAYLAITANAQQFGDRVPARAALVDGLICEVPTNYDPDTRTYSGLWDGTYKQAWTDDPAWCLRDLCLNPRYGLGQFVKAAYLDDTTLYAISQYASEQVDDGDGGTECRFSFNAVIQSRQDAYDLINAIASVFRGMVYWSFGTVFFAHDAPKTPKLLVTRANTVNGDFSYSESALTSVHNRINVTWNDPANFYKRAVLSVDDAPHIIKYGLRPKDIVAFGCTSKGQAVRAGNWVLYTERMESDVLTYVGGQDHEGIVPGDVVQVMDPSMEQADMGGRLKGYGSSSVTLDREVTLAAGETYELAFHDKARTLHYRTVTSAPGAQTTLTLDAPLPQLTHNPIETVWVLRKLSTGAKLYTVLSAREVSPHQYEVTALNYNPDKFAFVESGLQLPLTPQPLLPSGPLPAPIPSAFEQVQAQVGANYKPQLTVNVPKPTDGRVRGVELAYRRKGDSWEYTDLGKARTFALADADPRTRYQFRARSYSADNKYSRWSEVVHLRTSGEPVPTEVTVPLAGSLTGGFKQLTASWTAASAPNFDATEVWVSATNDVETATRALSTSAEEAVVPVNANDATRYVWVRTRLYGDPIKYSDFTALGSATTNKVAGTDIGDNAVTEENLAVDVQGAINSPPVELASSGSLVVGGFTPTATGTGASTGPDWAALGHSVFVTATGVDLADWNGSASAFIASVEMVGSVTESTGTDPDVYWGWTATMLPLARYAGDQSVRLRFDFYSRNVDTVDSCTLNWKIIKAE